MNRVGKLNTTLSMNRVGKLNTTLSMNRVGKLNTTLSMNRVVGRELSFTEDFVVIPTIDLEIQLFVGKVMERIWPPRSSPGSQLWSINCIQKTLYNIITFSFNLL